MSFGELVRQLREDSDQSIRGVAKKLNIDPSLLGKVERNERSPSKKLVQKIAEHFKQDIKYLTKQLVSDQFANMVLREEGDIEILRVAEQKVRYQVNK